MLERNPNKLWNQSINLIIGGCGLLSKRPTRYNSSKWPTYYKEAKGIRIKSINNIWYKDYSEFSIGCNLFGYLPNEHFKIIKKLKASPPLTTLLSPEGPLLAEELNNFLDTDKLWRFTRGGGEALALAIRYARAISSTDKVLACGYHGWHDWYLASNINSNKNLDETFLTGLTPVGVPKVLDNSTFAAKKFSIEYISELVNKENIKIIIYEAARYEYISEEIAKFLKNFKNNGGIIIADEVTSGLRVEKKLATYKLNIDPSIVVLGKGLGGGWPIAAIGSDKKFKNKLEDVFASSTFWTEQSGFIAARLTLDRLKDWNLFYKKLSSNSSNVKSCIIDSFKEENINLKINSIDTMISYKFNFNDFNERESSALLIDSLVEKKYLTSSTIYPNICHTKNENKKFKKMLKDSLLNLKEKISRSSEDTKSYLNSLGYLEKGFSRTQNL